jgi:hypothetical protein
MKLDITKILRIQHGEAIIIQYNKKNKMIIRKENDGMFYLVNPINLQKFCFNATGIYILASLLNGNMREEIKASLNKWAINQNINEDVEEFIKYLEEAKLV